MLDTTLDGILDRHIILEQPKVGFRVAIDTILLAAAVGEGRDILDLGCGVGGAMLALACRLPTAHVTGIEIQAELTALCASNITRNNLAPRLRAVTGDVFDLPRSLHGGFDAVMCNPPYHDAARHRPSPVSVKACANTAPVAQLVNWLHAAALALRAGGSVTVIHRADCLTELTDAAYHNGFSNVRVRNILSRHGAAPKRVLLTAVLGIGGSTSPVIMRDLVMHEADGSYTADAEAILRQVAAVGWGV